ncbi:Glycosyltransferase 61 catalytic domain-containing protein [Plasmodiophora brassicae]|uniref:Glycosyltransferase 61 catalytic domain-containing protein n=1 Tax=Plasmodiophora brassicae TaxID=37360 RepID=A0A0G4IIB6_PLABS|nr:hypothetical protein PBRA_003723 [Plasmodiophora brassicae]
MNADWHAGGQQRGDVALSRDGTPVKRSLFSTHLCKGDAGHRRGNRYCTFQNVCFRSSSEILYYWDGRSRPPPSWSNTSAEHDSGALWPGPEEPVRAMFDVVPGESRPFPTIRRVDGERPASYRFHGRPVLLVPHTTERNFGHFLGDQLLANYILMEALGREPSPDVDFIAYGFGDRTVPATGFHRMFSAHPAKSMDTLASEYGPDGIVCVDELYAGAANNFLVLETPLIKVAFDRFKRFALTNMGVWPPQPPAHHKVALFAKRPTGTRGRAVLNADTIVEHLRTQLTGTTTTVEVMDPASMSAEDQLRFIMETTVWVTPASGGSFIGMFLPRGSSVILLDIIDRDAVTSRRFGLDYNLWSQIPHLHGRTRIEEHLHDAPLTY